MVCLSCSNYEEKKKKLAMYERKKADIRNTFLTWIHSDTMKTLVWEFTKVWTYLEEKKEVTWRDLSQRQKYFQTSSRSP